MAGGVQTLEIRNYRSLERIQFDAAPVNVLFGPNGAGKLTFLDALWFVRDCAIRGVDVAASNRSHGIGVLWDRAEEDASISIRIETRHCDYTVMFGFSSGRIESFVGESLWSKEDEKYLIERSTGSDKARFYHVGMAQYLDIELREPSKLALTRYLDLEDVRTAADEVDYLLRFIRHYHSRSADFFRLRVHGSESDSHVRLYDRCENLWSVLRNLKDVKDRGDERYETILQFMQKAFPAFDLLVLEQTGVSSVYGNFVEKDRREPIKASGVSDGHLQMLSHLTALLSEGKREAIIILDEPETSLHPYALAVLAEAIELVAKEWNKQIFVATHSPVLVSQFDPEKIIAVEIGDSGETVMRRVSEIEDIQDLLEQYATGSLYMAELIAAQSRLSEVAP